TAERAQAFGHLANASGVRSTAVGEAANAGGLNSIAIGNQASASSDNQIALGGAGQLQASTATQAGNTNIVTTDANGTLGTSVSVASLATANQLANTDTQVANLSASSASNTRQINSLQNQYNRQEDRLDEVEDGIAMALALETPVIPSGKRYAMTVGTGYYSGGSALSTSFAGRVNDSITVSAGAGYGFDTGKVGARSGVTFAW
ncbi:MAG: YadA-like family protein, partial [Psychrobacter glacincola]